MLSVASNVTSAPLLSRLVSAKSGAIACTSDVCGVPWERRYTRLDETIQILRALETGEYADFQDRPLISQHQDVTGTAESIPMVAGGNGDLALRRAARYGDGSTSAGADDEFLTSAIARLMEMRKEFGRDHLPFDI